jgi:hypothetical protein
MVNDVMVRVLKRSNKRRYCMKHQCIIMFTCAAALLANAFSASQDTFKIGFLSSGIKFTVINVRTNESRLVAAVRETSGQYYLPIMSRMPEFHNKLISGYFDYDSLSMIGWDSVFITVAIVGDVPQDTFKKAVKKNVMAAGIQHRARAFQYDLRGCRVERPSGIIVTRKNGRIQKSVNICNYTGPYE